MKLAKFVNFTDEIFAHPSLGGHDELCQWGREPYCFPPKSSKIMEDWKAKFFAKHLTNRELLKQPMGEYHTSPKFPEQDLMFMEIFNKCVIEIESEEMSQEKTKDALIEKGIANDAPKAELPMEPDVWCVKCGSKGVRHKKGCPVLAEEKPTAESDFEGIK